MFSPLKGGWICNTLNQWNAAEGMQCGFQNETMNATELPPSSPLGMLGTQPPCCEEAQATQRGHLWDFSGQPQLGSQPRAKSHITHQTCEWTRLQMVSAASL